MEVNAIRYWIGDTKERQSSIWRIWNNNGDIYVTTKSLGGSMKLTFHGSGICQMGFTSEFWNKQISERELSGPRQSSVRWKRIRPRGSTATLVALFQYPTDLMKMRVDAPKARKGKPQFALEAANTGRCVEVAMFFCLPVNKSDIIDIDGWKSLFHADLPSGERNIVAVRQNDFQKSFIPDLSTFSQSPPIWSSKCLSKMKAGEQLTGLNCLLWSHPFDGEAIKMAEASGLTLTRNADNK